MRSLWLGWVCRDGHLADKPQLIDTIGMPISKSPSYWVCYWGQCVYWLCYWSQCVYWVCYWGQCVYWVCYWGQCVYWVLLRPVCITSATHHFVICCLDYHLLIAVSILDDKSELDKWPQKKSTVYSSIYMHIHDAFKSLVNNTYRTYVYMPRASLSVVITV